MNSPILKSSVLQEQFDTDGFAVFQLLDKNEVDACLNLYKIFSADLVFRHGIHISSVQSDFEQHQRINSEIDKILEKPMQKVLQGFKTFNSNFIVKSANHTTNTVPLHQDWMHVREDLGFRSGVLWIPLIDTNLKNGAIGIIKGSHKWLSIPRLLPTEYFCNPLLQHYNFLMQHLEIIPLRSGEAIFWDNGLLHASLPNSTDEERIVVSKAITEAEAPLAVFEFIPKTNEQRAGIFEVADDFFNMSSEQLINETYSKGIIFNNQHPVKEFAVEEVEFTEEEMKRMLDESGITEINDEIVEYLKELENKRMPVVTETDGEKPSWWKKLFRAG